MVEAAEIGRQKLRILVVDDEPRIREVLRELLDIEGYEVREAESGLAAIELIREFSPHIVFLDIRMPEMDGIHCLRMIKKMYSAAEVVMISGFATIEMAKRSLEIGAFDYIGKPLNFDHVRNVIRQIAVTKFVEFM